MAAKTWQGPILGILGCRGGPASFLVRTCDWDVKNEDLQEFPGAAFDMNDSAAQCSAVQWLLSRQQQRLRVLHC